MKKVNQEPVSLGVWCRKHMCFYTMPVWIKPHNEPYCPKCFKASVKAEE